MSAQITFTGNVTSDPELKFTQSNIAFSRFTVAINKRVYNKDTGEWENGKTTFLQCAAWRALAENVAGTLYKGMRVTVTGNLEQNDVEKDGEKRTYYQVLVDDVAVSIKSGTAKFEPTATRSNTTKTVKEEDLWAVQSDEAPF